MSNLVDSCMYLGFVSCDHSRRNKSEHRVLHATEWEGWRENKNVVLSPSIGDTDPLLNLIEIALQITKLLLGALDLLWLGYQANSAAK
jgi:hypothetical protein